MQAQPNKSVKYKTVLLSLAAFATALVAGVAITGNDANAQSSCKWYGTTALKQQQQNEKNKCGFTGPTWHSDLGAHMTWCGSVSPDEWKSSAKERGKQLAGCKK